VCCGIDSDVVVLRFLTVAMSSSVFLLYLLVFSELVGVVAALSTFDAPSLVFGAASTALVASFALSSFVGQQQTRIMILVLLCYSTSSCSATT
jgi:hypothetical protein